LGEPGFLSDPQYVTGYELDPLGQLNLQLTAGGVMPHYWVDRAGLLAGHDLPASLPQTARLVIGAWKCATMLELGNLGRLNYRSRLGEHKGLTDNLYWGG